MRLPLQGGQEATLRERLTYAQARIIRVAMLAADLWDARTAEAMRRGAVAYLAKPFGLDDLRELLVRR